MSRLGRVDVHARLPGIIIIVVVVAVVDIFLSLLLDVVIGAACNEQRQGRCGVNGLTTN